PGWEIDTSEASPDILVVSGEQLAKQLTDITPGQLSDAIHDKVIHVLLERARLMELKHLRQPSV
ncbi:MAG TPA: NERD domain-containing protein, partial [Halomonas sp.]|nr:NERD domain-containing protein [Halomonas sp.]